MGVVMTPLNLGCTYKSDLEPKRYSCCKQPDVTQRDVIGHQGVIITAILTCHACGDRRRATLIHSFRADGRSFCGYGFASAQSGEGIECASCVLVRLAEAGLNAAPDWRHAHNVAEDFYAV
jgi:hypothetical protein